MPESVPTTSQILQIYEVTRGGRSYIRPDASVGLDLVSRADVLGEEGRMSGNYCRDSVNNW